MLTNISMAATAAASVSSGDSAPKSSLDSYTGPRPMTYGDLLDLLKVGSRTTLYRFQRSIPDFPRPYRIGLKHVVFDSDEVAAWLEKQKAARYAPEEASDTAPAKRSRGGQRKTVVREG